MRRAHEILIRCASGIPESQVFTWPLSVSTEQVPSIRSVCSWIRTSSDELESIFVENDRQLERLIGFEGEAEKPWHTRLWRLSHALYESEESQLEKLVSADFVSFLLGVAFGRWRVPPESPIEVALRDPMLELPPVSTAESAPAVRDQLGILVSDPGHRHDIIAALEDALAGGECWNVDRSELPVACSHLDGSSSDVRWTVSHKLFEIHISRYSKSRRKAPIYWQIATASASYSVWLYFHAFTTDTLYQVQNEYAVPKLAHEERRLDAMRREHAGSPTTAERKDLATQEDFVAELREFLDEIKRVAPLWNPDLDDGVLLNFAPLWRLVPHHKPWQKELKTTWDALCAGEYDWAHLAMHLWPERVVPKCATDRSLAIAHGLLDIFWQVGANRKWKSRTAPTKPVEELVRERTSIAVKAALKNLLEAPTANANGGRTRGRRVANAVADGGAG
jgi:hypothetical protein